MMRTDEITTTIEIPAYLTKQDLEKVQSKTLRQIVVRGSVYLINMEKVSNVFSATIQLLLRIHDRAERLACPLYIINASDSVCNALNTAGVNEKISIYEKILQPELMQV
jgi:anti-anti-sigma regulatory factor